MASIEREAPARRLARAIVADLRLYHAAVIDRGGDLSEEIEEARQLYAGRVAPHLRRLFEEEIAVLDGGPDPVAPAAESTVAEISKRSTAASPFASFYEEPAPVRANGSRAGINIIVAVVLIAIAIAAVWALAGG